MNQYHQLLQNEYGKEYAVALVKWARQAVKASDNPMLRTAKQKKLVDDWEMSCLYYEKEDFRPYMLAVVAVKADEHKGSLTVNLERVVGTLFDRKHLRGLQEEFLVDILAVAPPYQFVFLLGES